MYPLYSPFLNFINNSLKIALEPTFTNGASKSKDFSNSFKGIIIPENLENSNKKFNSNISDEKNLKSTLKLQKIYTDLPLFEEKAILSCDDMKRLQKNIKKENYLKSHPFRNLIFSPVISVKGFNEHLISIQKELKFAKNSLKEPSEEVIQKKSTNLNGKKRKQ
jgi:hypothetical protein